MLSFDETMGAKYCRDDRCDFEGLHPWHAIDREFQWEKLPKFSRRDGVQMLLELMPSTAPISFTQLYFDLQNSYGSVTERTLFRWLEVGIGDGDIFRLPTLQGAYVRTDGRLFKEPGGILVLQELAKDLWSGR